MTDTDDVGSTVPDVTEGRLGMFLRIVGLLLLAGGLVGLYYGPLEIGCFYLFSRGGRFYHTGFGVGSFWFACLVAQNLIYYFVAAVCIPVGIGFLQLRAWSRQLVLTVLYSWLAFGTGISLGFAFSLGGLAGYYGWSSILLIGAAILVVAIAVPLLLLRVFNGGRITSALAEGRPGFMDRISRAVQVTVVMNAAFIILLHVDIFFNGMFPVFGRFIFLRKGIAVISAVILCLAVFSYGYALGKKWGFWGLLSTYALLLVSCVTTFARYSVHEILMLLKYSPYELREYQQVISMIKRVNFTALVASLLLVALAVLLLGRFDVSRNELPIGKRDPGRELRESTGSSLH